MSSFRSDSGGLESKMKSFFPSVPFVKLNAGILLVSIMYNDELGLNFSKDELKLLGERVKEVREDNFNVFLYNFASSLSKRFFDLEIPSFDSSEYEKLNVDYDLVKLVCNFDLDFGSVSEDEKKNVLAIREKSDDNKFKNVANRKINMTYLDGENFGFNGKFFFRKKEFRSAILKFLERDMRLRNPSDFDLYEAQKVEGRKVGKEEYYKKHMQYFRGMFDCGSENPRDYIENGFKDSCDRFYVKKLVKMAYMDLTGMKLVVPEHDMNFVNYMIRSKALESYGFKSWDLRFQNNMTFNNRDGSLVYYFYNSGANTLEFRMQTLRELLKAEVGEAAHCFFKLESERQVSDYYLSSQRSGSLALLDNLCFALGKKKRDILPDSVCL